MLRGHAALDSPDSTARHDLVLSGLMTDEKNRHPYLDGLQEVNPHRQTLWTTGMPVIHLLEREETFEKEPETEVQITEPEVQETVTAVPLVTLTTTGGPQVATEMLSPFTRWLTSLKPSGRYETVPPQFTDRFIGEPEIAKAKKKEKKGKKRKGKKKEKALAKSPKSPAELPTLGKDIATDTLAELIVNQGHIDEAIAMYEKLISLHPEKAAFYTKRIEDLRSPGA